MSTAVSVIRDPDRLRYVAVDGERRVAGFIDYEESGALVALTHTEVDPVLEGMGVGSALARAALDDIRERGLKARVTCPFITGWLRHHAEYRDLLDDATPCKAGE